MFGALIGAVPGIISAVLQMQAQHDANVINYENLQYQKQNAAQQYDLATSGRTDVYGNKEQYDPYTKQWKTVLTPEQQQITDALQRQQLLGLTEDANRARAVRARQDALSQQAAQDYQKARTDYLYNPPKSEGAYQDQAVTDQLFAQQDAARQAGNQLATLAVRSGQSKDALAGIVSAVANQMGKGIGTALQTGKAQGRQTFAGEQDIQNKKIDVMKYLQGVIGDVGAYKDQPFNTPADIAKLQGDQYTGISQALADAANQMSGAYKSLASSAGNSPDLSGIGDILSKFNPTGSTGNIATSVQPLGTGVVPDTSTPLSDRTTSVPLPRLKPGDDTSGIASWWPFNMFNFG